MEAKCIIFVVFLFGYLSRISCIEIPEHLKVHAERLHNKCRDATGVSEDIIAQSQKGHLADDRDFKCYIHCLFESTGLIDADNQIHLEHINELLPEETQEIINKLVAQCGTKTGSDPCETAYLTTKCYFEADPENALLV